MSYASGNMDNEELLVKPISNFDGKGEKGAKRLNTDYLAKTLNSFDLLSAAHSKKLEK